MNSFDFDDQERYHEYEVLYDPMRTDRQARRKRKAKVQHIPKKAKDEVIEEIADLTGFEGTFKTTYQPARYEEGWLLESLRPFHDQDMIVDVLAQVKGGKEASVYRCAAHPSMEETFLAAKVYRPRMFRNLRNDKMYREGRKTLTPEGKELKDRDKRAMRALDKKTAFGAQLEHTSWLMHEYQALETLYKLGIPVPRPVASGENCILMSYHGDEHMAAPTLNSVTLEPEEARELFSVVLHAIDTMLQNNMIHGDLSAYNILYWQGTITIIDFPQVVNSHANANAEEILQRDVTRICDYFASQGVSSDAEAITQHFWERYMARDPELLAADLSRLLEREPEEDDFDDDDFV